MLSIRRAPGESITIAGGITIYVNEISGGRVKIGIDAPRNIPVYRTEKADEREPLVSLSLDTPLGRYVRRAG
jgi:carbon storage regulator CsrA